MEDVTKPCVVCGRNFRPLRNPDRNTCSNRCYMYHERHPDHRDGPRTCRACAEPLPANAHRASRHCSASCRSATSKRRCRPIIAEYVRYSSCGHCGQAITGKAGKRYCSPRCEQRERLMPGSFADLSSRQCEHCGVPLPASARADRRHCTDRCTVLANQAIRRARKKRLPTERFSRFEIFERDGWVCHICHDPVDPIAIDPDPMRASLDHLIPFSDPASPGHIATNVSLAHMYCNLAKNGRTRPQDWVRHYALVAASVMAA